MIQTVLQVLASLPVIASLWKALEKHLKKVRKETKQDEFDIAEKEGAAGEVSSIRDLINDELD